MNIPARFLDAAGLERPLNSFDRNNAVSVFLMGALPAVAGSAISFMLAAFFVWGLLSLALGRFPFRMTHEDRLLAWTFTAFAALVVTTGLLAENRIEVFRATIWLLPFLSLWVVIPRLRASPKLDYLGLYIAGAVVGCIGALVFAGGEIFLSGANRAEGGAGNSVIFAVMCLCLAGMAGLAINAPGRMYRTLAAVAVLAGLIAVVFSVTRGVLLAGVPVMIVVLGYALRAWLSIVLRPIALIPVFAGSLLLYANWSMIKWRLWTVSFREFGQISDNELTSSLGERLRLWDAAWSAFLDSPLWGHGIQYRMEALVPYLAGDGQSFRGFTHPHNGFLAAAVDGGLVVLASLLALLAMPLVVAWRAPRDDAWRRRLFLALVLVTVYVTVGMTQIMFNHDIMDSFFIFTAIVVAVSIPDGRTAGSSDHT